MFVSESKFQSDPAAFVPHILNPNSDALLGLITKPAVEKALLVRLAHKARTYGQDVGAQAEAAHMKIDVDEVVSLYEQRIIPLSVARHMAPLTPAGPRMSRSSTCCTDSTGSRRRRSTS